MSNVASEISKPKSLIELIHLFGPPPVLGSENMDHYNEIAARLTECLEPRDFLELGQVRTVVDGTWEAQRYSRHRTLSVERRFRDSQEFQEKRTKDIKKRRDAALRELSEKFSCSASTFEELLEGEFCLETSQDIAEISDRIRTELQHASALEAAIDYHHQLERLINGALRRRDDALEVLEQYRAGLGQRLRKESDKIISAAAEVVEEAIPQVEAPSIAPAENEAAQ